MHNTIITTNCILAFAAFISAVGNHSKLTPWLIVAAVSTTLLSMFGKDFLRRPVGTSEVIAAVAWSLSVIGLALIILTTNTAYSGYSAALLILASMAWLTWGFWPRVKQVPDLSAAGPAIAPGEITARLASIKLFLDNNRDNPQLNPPYSATVVCEECKTTEMFPFGDHAAQSPHLLAHPEHCNVETVAL